MSSKRLLVVDDEPGFREFVVEVTEGLVDLHLGSRGTQRKIQPLEAGWKAEIDQAGAIVNMAEREGATGHGEQTLFAHWKLDNITEDGIVLDSGSKGVDGVFRDDSAVMAATGQIGNALAM